MIWKISNIPSLELRTYQIKSNHQKCHFLKKNNETGELPKLPNTLSLSTEITNQSKIIFQIFLFLIKEHDMENTRESIRKTWNWLNDDWVAKTLFEVATQVNSGIIEEFNEPERLDSAIDHYRIYMSVGLAKAVLDTWQVIHRPELSRTLSPIRSKVPYTHTHKSIRMNYRCVSTISFHVVRINDSNILNRPLR